MRKLIVSLTAMALLAGCRPEASEPTDEAPAELPMPHMAGLMEPAQVHSAMMSQAGMTLIDVRTPEEFAEGHIEGARNIDWMSEDFAKQVENLPKDKDYVLYCRSGHRSGLAQEKMQQMGFEHVASMEGGMMAWQDGELPVAD